MQIGNRYSPPQAPVTDSLTDQQPKPKGVLVLQFLAGMLALLIAFGVVRSLPWFSEDDALARWYLAHFWPSFLRRIAMMIVSGALVFLLQWRSQFARWSGVAWLALVMITPLVAFRPNFSTASAYRVNEYLTVMGIALPLFALVMYFAAFSKKARAYFRPEPKLPAPEAAASTPAPS